MARWEFIRLLLGDRGTSFLGGPPHGREEHFPQRRSEGDSQCPTTTWLPRQRQTRQGTALHKALYGLRQSPRAWNVKLDSTLLSLKFKRCASKYDMYTHGHGE